MKGSASFIWLFIYLFNYLLAQMEKSKEVQFSTSHKLEKKLKYNTSFAKLSFKTNSYFPFSFLFFLFFSLSL
jgi:hypothetical protein